MFYFIFLIFEYVMSFMYKSYSTLSQVRREEKLGFHEH